MERTEVDITGYSFDQFVAFLFATEASAPTSGDKFDPRYWHIDVTFIPEQICAYYTRLFRHPEILVNLFSKEQLEEGFWAIQVPNLDCSVYRVLENADISLPLRAGCIRSMFELFERLFATEPLDSSAFMWWDSLCFDWHCGVRKRERGGDDSELQDLFFETLAKILRLDSAACQAAALHGLGHLHHLDTGNLIDRYIVEHPSLTDEQRAYALAAAKFEVL